MSISKRTRSSHNKTLPRDLVKLVAEFAPREFLYTSREFYKHIRSKPLIYYSTPFLSFWLERSSVYKLGVRTSKTPNHDSYMEFKMRMRFNCNHDLYEYEPPTTPWVCGGCGATEVEYPDSPLDDNEFSEICGFTNNGIMKETLAIAYRSGTARFEHRCETRSGRGRFVDSGHVDSWGPHDLVDIYTCKTCRDAIDLFGLERDMSWEDDDDSEFTLGRYMYVAHSDKS